MNKINNRFGFTLMEIMVVIIVIAVLASVAGPMIGSITNQGRASATKSKLSALKSAILAYQSDVGRYPFIGAPGGRQTSTYYAQASVSLLGDTEESNVLTNEGFGVDNAAAVSNDPSTAFGISNYGRRWKGPYMDSTADDYMLDSWGTKIRYLHVSNAIWLWSAGADMAFDSDGGVDVKKDGELANPNAALDPGGYADNDGDDIVLSIARVRF